MSTTVARLIDLITKEGYPITTAANLAKKKPQQCQDTNWEGKRCQSGR